MSVCAVEMLPADSEPKIKVARAVNKTRRFG